MTPIAPDGVYAGRLAVTSVVDCESAPPVAPGVCASRSGEKRAADGVAFASATFESVTFSPEIALSFVPTGTFGWETYIPTKRPAAEPTTAAALFSVNDSVVDTCVMLLAVPLALSRPTAR